MSNFKNCMNSANLIGKIRNNIDQVPVLKKNQNYLRFNALALKCPEAKLLYSCIFKKYINFKYKS